MAIIALAVIYFFVQRKSAQEEPEDQEPEKTVPAIPGTTLFLAGDVMTGRGVDQIFPKSVDPKLYEPFVKVARQYVELAEAENGKIPENVDYDYIWGDALLFWNRFQPALRIINLETSITDHDEPWPEKGINYRMHPTNTQVLKAAEIDFCALANNHTLDWKRPGLAETLASLSGNDIPHAGAGSNELDALEPAVFETGEVRILIFSYGHKSSGIPEAWAAKEDHSGVNYLSELNAPKVAGEIMNYRKENDIVILSMHWGGNWGYQVPQEQQAFARELIDRGVVDIIHGHSSHHPKGIEVYKNKLIMYGAGDFINDYEGISGHDHYRGELSLMYFPSINPANGDLLSLKMVPMEIRKFQLNHASAADAEWLQNVMDRECGKFEGGVELVDGILEMR